MKFGKNLIQVVAISNPEWGQYWMNYKFLKKKIKGILVANGGQKPHDADPHPNHPTQPQVLSSSATEVEFFKLLRKELKKTCDFFERAQDEFRIRWERIWESYQMLHEKGVVHDKYTWTRLLSACVKFYKDVLLLENFAIMNYCGFSKILKKHDKCTGFSTRKAFMEKIMPTQNFSTYPYLLDLIKRSEKLFQDIQQLESAMPLQDEERLFIDAIRGLNYQASRMQAEEKSDEDEGDSEAGSDGGAGEATGGAAGENNNHNNAGGNAKNADAPLGASGRFEILTTGQLRSNAKPSASGAPLPTATQLSLQLDAATNVLVDAARRLNSPLHCASPDLRLALSWMTSTVKGAVRGADEGTDEELPEVQREDPAVEADVEHAAKKLKTV